MEEDLKKELIKNTQNPRKCRKLFVNCDGCLSCIAPFADDVTKEKCILGEGPCEFRIIAATGKGDPDGI